MPRSAVRETYAKAMEPHFVLMEARAVAGLMQLSLLFIAVPFVVISILYQFDVLGGRGYRSGARPPAEFLCLRTCALPQDIHRPACRWLEYRRTGEKQ